MPLSEMWSKVSVSICFRQEKKREQNTENIAYVPLDPAFLFARHLIMSIFSHLTR